MASEKETSIIMETVSAPTNIACIKYWGKADSRHNTPINSSVSVTLDQADLRAVTTVAVCTAEGGKFAEDRLWLNGVEEASAATSKRFRACLDGVKALATPRGDISKEDWLSLKIHVSSYNTFPTAAGLASSAAGYAALVAALAKLMNAKEEYEGQLSTIARQGSGSACRSLYGGFVAWRQGTASGGWSDSMAQQVADEHHWPDMRALILVVSDLKKDTSSTAGMNTSVETSLLLKHRSTQIVPERMMKIEEAYLKKDFEAFGELTMRDSNQFHAVCLDTYPPIFYMNDISRTVIALVHVYNAFSGSIKVAYTFDAGPNAVLYMLDNVAVEVGALMLHFYPEFGASQNKYINNAEYLNQIKAHSLNPSLLEAAQKTGRTPTAGDVKMMYFTKPGPGPQSLDPSEANLDPKTGLNTFQA